MVFQIDVPAIIGSNQGCNDRNRSAWSSRIGSSFSVSSVKKRRFISDFMRREIRAHFVDNTIVDKRHKSIAAWVSEQYRRSFNSAQIIVILGSTFHRVDALEAAVRSDLEKHRECLYLELEEVLFEWQQARQNDRTSMSGEL